MHVYLFIFTKSELGPIINLALNVIAQVTTCILIRVTTVHSDSLYMCVKMCCHSFLISPQYTYTVIKNKAHHNVQIFFLCLYADAFYGFGTHLLRGTCTAKVSSWDIPTCIIRITLNFFVYKIYYKKLSLVSKCKCYKNMTMYST